MKFLSFISTCILTFYFINGMAADSMELLQARLEPVGEVNIAGQQSAMAAVNAPIKTISAAETGKNVYDKHCVVCHAAGVAGAPKLGDAVSWKPRIAQGMNVLMAHVTNGFNAMPPKGTCVECSPADLQAAIEYIVKQAKGK